MAKNQNKNQDTRKDPTQTAPDVVNNMRFTCFEIAKEYINELDDPAEIKQNNGLFVDMLKYIYNSYLKDVIKNNNGNGNRYDYILLNDIFNIYTSLVYRYKQNKRCSILEFGIFTNINSNTLYNTINGHSKKLSDQELCIVKSWVRECENTLTNGSSVFEIFLLKSQYRYNDNLSPIPLSDQGRTLSAGELPDLSGSHNMITDTKTGDNKT